MQTESVTGTIERVVFQNPDSGWCVLKVKVKGRRRLVTVVGQTILVVPGETVEAIGEWAEHPEYGERFHASGLKTTLPRAASAAERFLSSGFVQGIGEELAHRMVSKFGASVFEVIENQPSLLRDVAGIGPSRAKSIQEAWREQKLLRSIMEFLGSHGLPASLAPRIFRMYGADSLHILQNHPYRLALEVKGIGFRSADVLARHSGLPLDSEERLAASLHDRLLTAVSRGHCAYPEDLLLAEAAKEIDVPVEKLEAALESEIESGRLTEEYLIESFGGEPRLCVFPSSLARAEHKLAEDLRRLSRGHPKWLRSASAPKRLPPIKTANAAAGEAVPLRSLQLSAIVLSKSQEGALRKILGAKVSILTGGPGTGKTTLIRAIHRAVTTMGYRVSCCAPTGRAAQRLTEASGVEAQTIHRLLGFDPVSGGVFRTASRPLETDLLILDEASMVGLELMEALAQALPQEAAFLLVGDVDQLPSIQAGRVLDSLIDSRVFTHIHLSEIFRQKQTKGNSIIHAAHRVISGEMPDLKVQSPDQDFYFIEARDSRICNERVVELVRDRIPRRFGLDALRDIQVLSPMNKGECGARALNRILQGALNPNPLGEIERFGQKYSIGDKVIVTANDYDKEVFNGDIGRIVQIEKERSSLRVEFTGRSVDFSFTELDLLSLAFAITIHKAQGSEYEAVVLPLTEESAPMLSRQLLYTALTRGKRLVVAVGSSQVLKRAIHARTRTEKRWSGLARRLVEGRGLSIEI